MTPGRSLPPLPRKVALISDNLAIIPPGYGFLPLTMGDLAPGGRHHGQLLGLFEMYEPPLRGHAYIIGADIADGLGQDRTSIDVLRLGTIDRPAEQVGHYLSDQIKPREAAFIIDALGHLYVDDEGYEALAGVETNNHGMSTQDTLKLHLGYRHFYQWENAAASNSANRFSPRDGWYTTQRTRPMLLDHLYEALTTYDPITGDPDLVLNSSRTIAELQDFQTDGALVDAAAAAGAHDDCLMSVAIAHYIGHRKAGGEREPLAERRRRLRQIELRQEALARLTGAGNSFQNMPYTSDEMEAAQGGREDRLDPEAEEALYDVRGVIYDYY